MNYFQALRLARRGEAASTSEDAARVLKIAQQSLRMWRWMRWVGVAAIAADLALMGWWIARGTPHLVRGILAFTLYPCLIIASMVWNRHLLPRYRRAVELNESRLGGE